MANIENKRMLQKRTTLSGVVPSLKTGDHTDGSWSPNDVYPAEFFIDLYQSRVYIGMNSNVMELANKSDLDANSISISTLSSLTYQNYGDIQTLSSQTYQNYSDIQILSANTLASGSTTYTGDSDVTIGGINQGDLFIETSMQDMWYDLLHPYQTPTFSFNSNLPTTVEVGTELNAEYTFNWNTTNPSNVSGGTINLTGPNGLNLTSLDTTGITGITINITNTIPTSETWTLNGTDTQSSPINAYDVVNWRYKRFYGTSPNLNIIDSEILSLNSEFSTNRLKTWTQNGNGEYIYYCYPSSFGDNDPDPPFLIGNLPNSGWLKTIRDIVISTGEIVEYIIYRTITTQNGSGIEIQKL